ncbi:MAG: FAD-dependent oxidoreductase [Desulfomonilaceae bacterium]
MSHSFASEELSRSTRGDLDPRVVYSADPADFRYMAVNVPCQSACPALTNIPAYIRALYEQKFGASYEINRAVNLLPATLGRICSRPCELKCRHGETGLGESVNICHIKRAASDFRKPGHAYITPRFAPVGKTVCIVGSGPAGLAASHDLAIMGFDVTVYESCEEAGGMLRYGIPEFRLPRNILSEEIQNIFRLGVSIKTGVRVGRDLTYESLLSRFDAVLVAAGCYRPIRLDAPGEDMEGVHSGLNFVMDIASGKKVSVGKRALVIGAGFTAFDCSRLALRLGAEDVSICIRGFEEDLRVTADEIFEAKREGIKIRSLALTKRILGTDKASGIEFLRTRPSERDQRGRRKVEPIPDSEFTVEADTIIVAIGQAPEAINSPGTKDRNGVLTGDRESYKSSLNKLYVTGDYLTGPTTVIEAIANGRRSAEQIARDLTGRKFKEWMVSVNEASITDRDRSWDFIPRHEIPTVLPVKDRLAGQGTVEVETGYHQDHAIEESKRCYLCYLHYEIDVTRCIYCRYCIDNCPRDCIKLVKQIHLDEVGAVQELLETTVWSEVNAVVIDNPRCIRCGECVRVCPVDCISVSKVELVERPAALENEI